MTIEDINSYRPTVVKQHDSCCTSIFQLACVTTMKYILGNHNNIKSFRSEYTVVPENGENLVSSIFKIKCADDVSIMLGDCGNGSKSSSTIVYGKEICIGITYQFTHPITHETAISDICEELHRLIMVLLHYDKIKLFEYKRMQGPANYTLTEQDLKAIMDEYDLDNCNNQSAAKAYYKNLKGFVF